MRRITEIIFAIKTGTPAFTLLWLLLGLGGIHAALNFYAGAQALFIPYATTRIEAFVLDGVLRFTHGSPIYEGLDGNTFIVHVYNPLCYLVTGLFGRIFQLDTEGSLLTGRVISFLSTLTLAVVLALWIKGWTGKWRYGLVVVVGLFFFQAFAATDFFRLRPEAPALLFTFLGVLAFQSQSRQRLWLSAGLFLIAFLFKQPFISAPIAVFLYLLVSKEFRAAMVFCAIMGGLLLLFFAVGYAMTDGRLLQNTITAMSDNVIHPFANLAVYGPLLWARAFALVLVTPMALWTLARLWPKYRFLLIYFGVCLFWTFLSAGKQGAGDNYFSELTILSLLLIALALWEGETQRPLVAMGMLVLLAAQVVVDNVQKGVLTPSVKVQFEDATNDLSPYISRYQKLAGDNLILHEKIAVHVGNPVGLDWYLMDILMDKGLVDPKPLYEKIRNGGFDRVVFNQRPLSRIEHTLFDLVRRGPYRRGYADQVVSEWVRVFPGQ